MVGARNITSIAILVLLAPLARAQQLPELLQAVNDGKAQQLVEYNSPWLQEQLYSAKRFRIAMVDTSLLLKDDDFALTPFDDTAPLHLTRENVLRYENTFAWNGLIVAELPQFLRQLGARQTVLFSGVAWDTDQSGRASESSANRSEQSRRWTNKRAFYSVTAYLELVVPNVRYMLVPLQYTPKYSVVLEVDRERIPPIRVDTVEGEPIDPDPVDQKKLADYERFIRNLPARRDVPIVEELP